MELSEQELQRVREISLHAVLGLKNNGRTQLISCPYHRDKTPSMAIYPDNSYYCFGCGIHGNNSIDFLMEDESTTFISAIEELIKFIGN